MTRVQAYAVQVGPPTCACSKPRASCPRLVLNDVINGGKNEKGEVDLHADRVNRCREAQADDAFMWFAFACFLGSFMISFVTWRRGGMRKLG